MAENMDGHLWTESFLRLISSSCDAKKFRALQQIILHKQGRDVNNQRENSFQTEWLRKATTRLPPKKIKIKVFVPKNFLKDVDTLKIETSAIILNNNNETPECRNGDFEEVEPKQNLSKALQVTNKNKRTIASLVFNKNFLLSKNDVLKSDDAEIITKIVMEKFKSILNKRYNRVALLRNHMVLTDSNGSHENVSSKSQDLYDKLEDSSFDDREFLNTALEGTDFNISGDKPITTHFPISDEQDSINTAQVSILISQASSVNDVFTKQHSDTPSLIEEETTLVHNSSCSSLNALKTERLTNDFSIQAQIIQQTCKALNACMHSKGFSSSVEYVEAEKILLLATQTRDAILKELLHGDEEQGRSCFGRVTLSNLTIPFHMKKREVPWCFLAILRSGSFVLASEETTMCLTPFYKSPVKRQQEKYYGYEEYQPLFQLCAFTSIRLCELSKRSFKLTELSPSSKLKGILIADLSWDIKFAESYSSFLTVGYETSDVIMWNRRWCKLDGYLLKYWNYPEQEVVEPYGVIDLSFSKSECISQVEREFCARPRTLVLEIDDVSKYRTIKYYLSADDINEFIRWQNMFNSVVSTLRIWKRTKI